MGIRKPEEQVDTAQGYFDDKQGTTLTDNRKEDKEDLLVKALQGILQGESKGEKPTKEWKKDKNEIQDLNSKVDRLVSQIERLSTRENQNYQPRYPPRENRNYQPRYPPRENRDYQRNYPSSDSRNYPPRERAEIQCYKCGQQGHYASECNNQGSSRNSEPNRKDTLNKRTEAHPVEDYEQSDSEEYSDLDLYPTKAEYRETVYPAEKRKRAVGRPRAVGKPPKRTSRRTIQDEDEEGQVDIPPWSPSPFIPGTTINGEDPLPESADEEMGEEPESETKTPKSKKKYIPKTMPWDIYNEAWKKIQEAKMEVPLLQFLQLTLAGVRNKLL